MLSWIASSDSSADRSHPKTRKFSTFMKRLASLKSAAAGPSSSSREARIAGRSASFSSGTPSSKQSPKIAQLPSLSRASSNGHLPYSAADVDSTHSKGSLTSTSDTGGNSDDLSRVQTMEKSRPPPSATTATTSAFSSPTPSVRSLTTTLTTIQSTAPGSMLNSSYNPHPSHHHNPNGPPQMYSAPFDSNNPHNPATTGLLHPVSYNAATANGVWTDNASIITLASSSKRRRRSFDTDASVRAMAPSSVFGGSRESLPLSVLSSNFDPGAGGRSIAGERSSLYGGTSLMRSGDAASMSGGGTGSIMGEISNTGPATGSPLISAVTVPGNRESLLLAGRHSRRSSGWNMDNFEGEDLERRSLSARSISFKEQPEGDQVEVLSVRDGSSNVGVWNGIYGKPEGPKIADENADGNFKKE
jgi:hypothetical protein